MTPTRNWTSTVNQSDTLSSASVFTASLLSKTTTTKKLCVAAAFIYMMNHHRQLREFSKITTAQVKTQSGIAQIKQERLISSVFSPAKPSVNYGSISRTRRLNKYLIKPGTEHTHVQQEKSITIFLFDANGL